MQLYAKPGNTRTQRLLTLAKINEIDIGVTADANNGSDDMYGKIPVLDTGKGCIFASNAIGRYLARMRPDIGLYGQNFIESGEVDSWVEFSTHELETPVCAWTFPMEKIFPEVSQATSRAKIDVDTCLKVLNKHLTHRTFMVGEKITFADVHIASVLYNPIEKHSCLSLDDVVHLKRWYALITSQPAFKSVFGAVGVSKEQQNTKGNQKNNKAGAGKEKAAEPNKQANKGKGKGKAKAEPAKDTNNNKAPQAPPSAEEERKKKLKAVIKEGGKRGVEIEGVSDMGGLNFFCTAVDKPEGDLELLKESVKAMNAKCDPSEEERKGGSGHVGKMIFSSDTDLAIVCYVPEKLQDKVTAPVWMKATLKAMNEDACYVEKGSSNSEAYALMKGDKDKGRFAIKLKDEALSQANAYLRTNGLFPDDDDDDDDFVFGDEDFPS